MNKTIPAVVAAAVGLALCGCATRSEPEFGSSVRHMVEGQTYDPRAPREATGALDGRKAAKAVDKYLSGKAPESTTQTQTSVLIPTTTQ